jgi:hypothetical protein
LNPTDKQTIQLLTTNGGDPYKNHPYPEVTENIFGIEKKGGAIPIQQISYLINLPSKWLKEHQKLYRNKNLLKLLSLNPQTIRELIKNISVTSDSEPIRKLLVLILFWDAQELIGKFQSLQKSTKYLEFTSNYEKNIDIFKPLIDFSDYSIYPLNETKAGQTAKFVLTEDLIRFYKKESDSYIKQSINGNEYNDNFSDKSCTIFSLLIQDYIHWKQIERNFKELVDNQLEKIRIEIDIEYKKLNDDPIKTYLKIRCDEYDQNLYNEYFNIFINKNLDKSKNVQSLFIAGPNPNLNIPFYKNNSVTVLSSKEKESITLDENNKLKSINKYDYGYLYGPFTRIFLPNQNNEYVSENCKEILDKLVKKESAFVIGYGQSGAGKTSSLICREYKNSDGTIAREDGIILNLLKNRDIGVREIYLTIKELYVNKSSTISYTDIKFILNDKGNFEIDKDSSNNKEGKYLQKNKFIIKGQIEWKDDKYCEWKIENGIFYHSRNSTSDDKEKYNEDFINKSGQINDKIKPITLLSEFITCLVNDIRMVRPTPNNKQSSRSHVLIFFKLSNVDPYYLILGDLAGVENKFLCSDPYTKKEFSNLKLPLQESDMPYYVNYKYVELIPQLEDEKIVLEYFNYKTIDQVNDYVKYLKDIENKNLKFNEFYRNYSNINDNEVLLTNAKSVEGIINLIYDKCKLVLKNKIEEKHPNLLKTLENKFYIDFNFNKSRYSNDEFNIKELTKDNSWFDYKCTIKETSKNTFIRTDPNYINTSKWSYYIDISNYLKYHDEKNTYDVKNNFAKNINGTSTGPYHGQFIDEKNPINKIKDFSDPKNTEKLYMPYVSSGLDTKNHHLISNFINDINKKSHLNNIAKLTTDKDFIDHYFDILHAEIYKDPSSKDFNLNDIYSILEDGNNTFLNNLPLTDIYTCYNHFLKEKIEFQKNDKKIRLYYIKKHLLIVPLAKFKIIEYKENNSLESKIRDIQTPEMISRIKKLKKIIDNYYDIITKNINVYYVEIESRCNDREIEGTFINRSLYGIRKNIAEISKKLGRKNALFQKIPIFNSACLEYYCNSELYNCFKLPSIDIDIKKIQPDESIFETIYEIVGKNNSNINIVIFGVLNISRDVNDPPIMPYINLTNLKQIRDILHTNHNYDNNPKIIEEMIKKIRLYIKDIIGILNNYKNSISHILYNPDENKGELIKKIDELINETNLSKIYKLLIDFIEILEEINSVSLLGTIDFLHSMKNSLETDISCNILNLDDTKKEIAIKEDLYNYTNIITNQSFEDIKTKINIGENIKSENTLINEYIQLLKK